MTLSSEIERRVREGADPGQASVLMRFFKTAPGEYGEGDCFLGVRVPFVRSVVKDFRRRVSIDDVRALLASKWHEIRLAGLLSLVEVYKREKRGGRESDLRGVVDFYLSVIDRGNNWDLVDVIAPKILGDWLVDHPDQRGMLDSLVAMDGCLWHQRVGIVSMWTLIRNGEYSDLLRITPRMLSHPHDLIHKATGWMLREMGKRGGMRELKGFLDRYAPEMPRTMLRYAIEQLPEQLRRHYMAMR